MRLRHFAIPVGILTVLSCTATITDNYAALPAIGSEVPAFRYTTFDRVVLTPQSIRGRPTVIALWATTCSASRLAIKSLSALQSAYAPLGANVVILADDRDSVVVSSLLEQTAVQPTVALAAGTLMDTFTHGQSPLPWRKAFALPTFLVLDAAGRVVYRQIGIERSAAQQLERVRATLDSLLSHPPPSDIPAPAV